MTETTKTNKSGQTYDVTSVMSVGRAILRALRQVTTDDDEDEKQNTFHFTKADDACASAALIIYS